jgi:hypothetical protein
MLTLSSVATGNDEGGAHSFISVGTKARKKGCQVLVSPWRGLGDGAKQQSFSILDFSMPLALASGSLRVRPAVLAFQLPLASASGSLIKMKSALAEFTRSLKEFG